MGRRCLRVSPTPQPQSGSCTTGAWNDVGICPYVTHAAPPPTSRSSQRAQAEPRALTLSVSGSACLMTLSLTMSVLQTENGACGNARRLTPDAARPRSTARVAPAIGAAYQLSARRRRRPAAIAAGTRLVTSMATQRYKVAVQYLGGAFHGWQSQSGGRVAVDTVQDTIEGALTQLVGAGNHGRAVSSSRTDTGVHALHNVFHVDLTRRVNPTRAPTGDRSTRPFEPVTIKRALNHFLRHESVAVTQVDAMPPSFHARRDATARTYVYRLLGHARQASSPFPDRDTGAGAGSAGGDGRRRGRAATHSVLSTGDRPALLAPALFERDRAWVIPQPLDVDAMQRACASLVGTHDYSSFRAAGCQAPTPVRTLHSVRLLVQDAASQVAVDPAKREWQLQCSLDPLWQNGYQALHLVVHGESFLYHMVRNMASAIVAVGCGIMAPEELVALRDARDRTLAPATAPARGLYLARVHYAGDEWDTTAQCWHKLQ